ncbi:MAG: class I SAM-dependent methyltransferase [Planctomycetota bacterium]|nr:class I SAM-dependent methyltransferase [Planctomycetota bacterium]
MTDADVRAWCAATGCRVLRRLGLSEGDAVADFGCREGRYAVPAARVVGRTGCVYAIDRDREALSELKQRARTYGLSNIRTVRADFLHKALPFAAGSLDLVLLFDVLHGVFFPDSQPRVELLRRVREMLKSCGILAVYPTHAAEYGPPNRQLETEIRDAGFDEIDRSRRRLLHDGQLVRGWVLLYRPHQRTRGRRESAGRDAR